MNDNYNKERSRSINGYYSQNNNKEFFSNGKISRQMQRDSLNRQLRHFQQNKTKANSQYNLLNQNPNIFNDNYHPEDK